MRDVLSPSEHRLLARFIDRLLAEAPSGAVARVAVFGSRARGDSMPGSDLDVAITPGTDADRRSLGRLATDLAFDVMQEMDRHELALAPLVVPEAATGLAATIAAEGVPLWPAP